MHQAAAFLLASVWFANGFGAKVLGLVPRHRLIVARFFGDEPASILTRAIGAAEVLMAVWILSGFQRPLCAGAQGVVVVTMNSLEYWRARDLLAFPVLMPFANAALLALAFWWGLA